MFFFDFLWSVCHHFSLTSCEVFVLTSSRRCLDIVKIMSRRHFWHSWRCPDDVETMSMLRWCRDDVDTLNSLEGVKTMSRRCRDDVETMSRRCQDDVKTLDTLYALDTLDDIEKMSRWCQNNVKIMPRLLTLSMMSRRSQDNVIVKNHRLESSTLFRHWHRLDII